MIIHGLCAFFASNSRFMRLFQAALDTPLDSPFSATLSVHSLHFTLGTPSKKVLGPSGPKSLNKASGRVRRKTRTFSRLFGLSPRLFFRLLGPEGPRTFRDFFQTFGARGSEDFFETFFRLLGFRPGDSSSQAGEVPTQKDKQTFGRECCEGQKVPQSPKPRKIQSDEEVMKK